MTYDPDIHHRRSIRLRGYDYSSAGAYFVTICTRNQELVFGDIIDGSMILNDAGMMVQTVWDEIPSHYPGIEIDEFIIMPNHIHGITIIVGAAPRGRPGSVRAIRQAMHKDRPTPRNSGRTLVCGPVPITSSTRPYGHWLPEGRGVP